MGEDIWRRASEKSLAMRFEGIIKRACQQEGQSVVILVDEYDKPMLQAIGDDVLQKSFRNTLKAFYGALKSQDGCIKFALLTGVTKFGKVSVFSDLNNLNDISMWNKYIDICGVSEQELYDNLDAELHEFANVQGVTYEEICVRLKEMYDGYHFTHNSKGMYNPFSLLLAFDRNEFKSYWFETGTPTYLVELLKKHHYDLHRMAHEETDEQVLNSIDSESTNPIPVIYQSGYLTIKGYDEEFGIYRLGFLIVKWRKDLSVFCFLIMRTSIKWNLPLKFRNSFVRYVLVITNLFSVVCKVSFLIFHTSLPANWSYIIRMYFILYVNWSVFM